MITMQLKRTIDASIGGLWGLEPREGEFGIAVVRVADFDYPSLTVSTAPTSRVIEGRRAGPRSLRKGDLLIEKSGGGDRQNVGRVVQWTGDQEAIFSNFINLLRPARGFSSRWLAYLHRHLYLTGAQGGCTKQTTGIQNLDLGAYLGIRVAVPALDEQQQIANFLDRECSRITELSGQLRSASGVTGSLISGLFDDRTAGQPRIRLRFVLSAIEQGWSPVCDDREAHPGEWGVLKVGCVNHGHFRDDHKALGEGLTPREALEVRPDDLLMSRANTRDLVGSCAVVGAVRPRLMMSDLLYRLLVDTSRWDVDYVAAALSARSVREQIRAYAAGSAGSMPKLNHGLVKEITIPALSLGEQRDTVAWVRSHSGIPMQIAAEYEELHAGLADYRDALITEAIAGELDVMRLSDRQMDESVIAAVEGTASKALLA